MEIGEVLRKKRKAAGLTQEQVANALGITAPAVNKWEHGLSCPDLALLPALARLLRTDPNTLLSFQEKMTDREITFFTNQVAEKIQMEAFTDGFALAMDKLREYPHCIRLRSALAMVLDGALMITDLPESEKEPYHEQIKALYEQIAQSDDPALANPAKYMLASQYLQQDDYGYAQELLDQMPDVDTTDKRTLQADLYIKQGRTVDAEALLERLVLAQISETLMIVTKLVPLLEKEGCTRQAERLASASKVQQEAYGLWQYSAYLAPLELARVRKDAESCLHILKQMLDAVIAPGDLLDSPLYCHQSGKETPETMTKRFLPSLLADLETNPDFAFLREDPGFYRLISDYKSKARIT